MLWFVAAIANGAPASTDPDCPESVTFQARWLKTPEGGAGNNLGPRGELQFAFDDGQLLLIVSEPLKDFLNRRNAKLVSITMTLARREGEKMFMVPCRVDGFVMKTRKISKFTPQISPKNTGSTIFF